MTAKNTNALATLHQALLTIKNPLRENDYRHLPNRVQRRIEKQQFRSDILVTCIQLLIVSIFTILYALSPKTFAADVAFTPVPWALAFYFAFTLVRLVFALRQSLPRWANYLSIVLDMSLLMALIWSFHLQYEQPPSFYLKAPTLLYVFIFIALRSLHFDPRYLIASGVAGVVGWGTLVLYVTLADGNNPMITRDYVSYLTSNSILLGAEFDKIISIIFVTCILTLAIERARHLLIMSVVESSAAEELSHFAPQEVVTSVITSEEGASAGQGSETEATILFTDIANFTQISERLTPTELITALNHYFALIAKPIQEHGGVINQFQGDAILATFNTPKTNPDHACCAIKAALEIQALTQDKYFETNEKFKTRVGINTGRIVGGLVGSDERLGFTVHGENVNLAARLEALNKTYDTSIILSESTKEEAGSHFIYQELGEVSVRGLQRKLRIYTLKT